jgi:hypothetical protein
VLLVWRDLLGCSSGVEKIMDKETAQTLFSTPHSSREEPGRSRRCTNSMSNDRSATYSQPSASASATKPYRPGVSDPCTRPRDTVAVDAKEERPGQRELDRYCVALKLQES